MLCVEVEAPELGETGLLAFIPSCRLTGSMKRNVPVSRCKAMCASESAAYQSKGGPLLLVQSDVLDGRNGGACLGSQSLHWR